MLKPRTQYSKSAMSGPWQFPFPNHHSLFSAIGVLVNFPVQGWIRNLISGDVISVQGSSQHSYSASTRASTNVLLVSQGIERPKGNPNIETVANPSPYLCDSFLSNLVRVIIE